MYLTIRLGCRAGSVFLGLGPGFIPKPGGKMISTMTQLPDTMLRRFGGGLVVAGIVIYYMLTKTVG
ncbi:DUF2065 domain-containing protein [Escherichia coli]